MKTIEERASNYAETRCINVESDLHKRLLMDAFSSSYIQGAKDQRDIDIEKAWKWIEDIIFPYVSYYIYTDCIDRKDAFREFMEK